MKLPRNLPCNSGDNIVIPLQRLLCTMWYKLKDKKTCEKCKSIKTPFEWTKIVIKEILYVLFRVPLSSVNKYCVCIHGYLMILACTWLALSSCLPHPPSSMWEMEVIVTSRKGRGIRWPVWASRTAVNMHAIQGSIRNAAMLPIVNE